MSALVSYGWVLSLWLEWARYAKSRTGNRSRTSMRGLTKPILHHQRKGLHRFEVRCNRDRAMKSRRYRTRQQRIRSSRKRLQQRCCHLHVRSSKLRITDNDRWNLYRDRQWRDVLNDLQASLLLSSLQDYLFSHQNSNQCLRRLYP